MSNRRTPKRPIYRVNLKLDYELDEDLIAWMEAQPRGALSQAIREALRRVLQVESQAHQQAPDYEYIRLIVADELARVLAGLHLQTQQSEAGTTGSDTEVEYGARLDQMLGGLSANTDPGDS
jgi:hypothetical protein